MLEVFYKQFHHLDDVGIRIKPHPDYKLKWFKELRWNINDDFALLFEKIKFNKLTNFTFL